MANEDNFNVTNEDYFNVTNEDYFNVTNEGYFSVMNSSNTSTEVHEEEILPTTLMRWLLPLEIIIGVVISIVALIILIRRRLWLQHEGYVYVGAILILNVAILTFDFGSIWVSTFDDRYHIENASSFTCKVWNFFFTGYSSMNWLVIAFLLEICIRSWAEKSYETGLPIHSFCTIRSSLIVCVIVITVTLLINSWKLFTFELESNSKYQDESHSCNCVIGVESSYSISYIVLFTYVLVYGLPLIFVLPVLFDLIASACSPCTGYTIGSDSSEHFPRGTLLAFGGIIYLLLYPLEGSRLQVYWLPTTYVPLMILTEALVFVILAFLCLAAMPMFRNEIKEKLGFFCRKGYPGRYEDKTTEQTELEESIKEK